MKNPPIQSKTANRKRMLDCSGLRYPRVHRLIFFSACLITFAFIGGGAIDFKLNCTARILKTPIGTLIIKHHLSNISLRYFSMQKTHLQVKRSVKSPPRIGPSTDATARKPPYKPNNLGRCSKVVISVLNGMSMLDFFLLFLFLFQLT